VKRGGPLRRLTPLHRRSGLASTSTQYRRAHAAWKVARFAAYRRSAGFCEICGVAIYRDAYEAHHRKLRSQGGTDAGSNLLALCPGPSGCHARIHMNPTWAKDNGWIVHPAADPALVLVLVAARGVVHLTDDGYREVA
jgi:hypothetical protein